MSTVARRAVVALPVADDALALAESDRDAAISALFVAEAARLTAVAQLLTGDRAGAEDLVQDAFVTLYRRWHWVDEKNAAAGYLMAAVVKGAKSALRRRYSARNLLSRLELQRASDAPSVDADAMVGEERHALVEAVAHLPMRQRQVMVLRYYGDRSEQEIADILAISRGSVKRHASRALTSLARSLEGSS